VSQAFRQVSPQAEIVVIHDAARPLVRPSLIAATIEAAAEAGAAVAAVPVVDTVKRGNDQGLVVGTIPRAEVFLAQTPQAFRVKVLAEALAFGEAGEGATDEAMLAEAAGHAVRLVPGDPRNLKITTPEDLELAERLMMNLFGLRIGNGYDLHRLSPGRPLVLGGVTIPFDKGLLGHSDGDAVCHAITDAMLGAARAGDIGQHFPDTDAAWKGADSLRLLARAAELVRRAGYAVVSIDVVVIADQPKIAPFLEEMRVNLAAALRIDRDRIGVKGKTNEGCDSMGTGESMAVHAVALLVTGSPSAN
jgi:2-C-methyl-D-erythritol 2,4-cyclodiphosphate synthase